MKKVGIVIPHKNEAPAALKFRRLLISELARRGVEVLKSEPLEHTDAIKRMRRAGLFDGASEGRLLQIQDYLGLVDSVMRVCKFAELLKETDLVVELHAYRNDIESGENQLERMFFGLEPISDVSKVLVMQEIFFPRIIRLSDVTRLKGLKPFADVGGIELDELFEFAIEAQNMLSSLGNLMGFEIPSTFEYDPDYERLVRLKYVFDGREIKITATERRYSILNFDEPDHAPGDVVKVADLVLERLGSSSC